MIPENGLRVLGCRNVCANKQNKSEVLHEQLEEIVLGDRKYAWAFPTLEDVYVRTERFNSEIPIYDAKRSEKWSHILEQEYPFMMNSTLPDFDELTYRPDAAVGPLADKCCRKTSELLRKYGARLDEYWDKSPERGDPWVAKTAGKVEMLPLGKRPRTFVFFDKFMSLCGTRVCSDINERMKLDRHHTKSAIGMSIYGIEWIELGNMLDSFEWKLIADVSEWDARFGPTHHQAISKFRERSMIEPRGKTWIRYMYDCIQSPIICMPSGEIVMVDHGQPSGQPSTSTDNTFGHTIHVHVAEKKTRREQPDFLMYCKLYADDLVAGMNKPDVFPELLKKEYLKHKFVVKEGAFSLTRRLEDVTFLGGKFRKCPQHGCWTYVPSKQKLLESIASCDKEMNNEVFYNKVFSLFILGFHTKWRERFRKIYLDARRLLTVPPPHWTDKQIEQFVHGLEGAGERPEGLYFDTVE